MILYKDIIKEDNNDLRKISEEVKLPLSNEDKETMLSMYEYLVNSYDEDKVLKYGIRPGVGFSAVQIDVLKRMFAMLAFDEKGDLHSYCVINPKIISHSEQTTYLEGGEGCLSVDRDVKGLVHRPNKITVNCHLFDPETGDVKEVSLRLRGYISIVFQHEYDHLNGILFHDHINKANPFYIPINSIPVKFKGEEE